MYVPVNKNSQYVYTYTEIGEQIWAIFLCLLGTGILSVKVSAVEILSLILLDFSCLPGGGVGLSRVDHALSLSVAFPVVRLAVYIQLSFV